jgi:hypothetical protein
MATLVMSARELDRLDVIQRLQRQEITGADAARLLTLSLRQVWRLKRRVATAGAAGLIHCSRGQPGNRRMSDRERTRVVRLLRTRYADFGPTFASEKLAECHGLARDPKTIRTLMIAERLWTPNVRRRMEHRSWRQRKAALGEMIQFDGSYEPWLEARGPSCCLLAGIDDATGNVLSAQLASDEGVFPVFTFWRSYVERYGVPRSVYLDRFSTYKMTQRVAVENHDLKTQFQRALEELRCEPIFAYSPQAKGRVERLFGTLQDRLVKELRLAGISTIAAGNQFLAEVFLPAFNRRFAVTPASPANLHRPLTGREKNSLDATFARQETRVVRNDWTVAYGNQWYQLTRQQPVTVCKRDTLTVEERLNGTIHFRLRGKYLNATPLPARPPKASNLPWVLAKAVVEVPAAVVKV